MAPSLSLPSRTLGVGGILLGVSRAFLACGGSSTDAPGTDPDSGISDAGQSVDAAAPSDANTSHEASTQDDTGVDVDAGVPDAEAGVFDAGSVNASLASDFSATSNPNGAWSYGYSLGAPGSDAATWIVYPTTQSQSDVDCWYDANNVALGAPAACYNGSQSTTSTGVAPSEAALHPGQNGEYSIARWTAPAAGAYVVHVQFKAGDQGETDGMLVHNGAVLWSVAATSTNPTDDRTVTMAAGDTLDVAVGSDGSFLYDTTPTIFMIHSAP